MINKLFPTSYILDNVCLTWAEVLWGYKNGFLNSSSVIEIAVNSLIEGSNNTLVVELAGLSKEEDWRLKEILQDLSVQGSSKKINSEYKKWLYLTLKWIYMNKHSLLDPLAEVEEVYADFNYPQEMEQFIRYMPVIDNYDSSKHTHEENEQRLYQKWKEYLIQEKKTSDS